MSHPIFTPLISDVRPHAPVEPLQSSEMAGPSAYSAAGIKKPGSSFSRHSSLGGIFRLKHSESHLQVLHPLPRCLTFWDLIPLGVGATIGAGVYVLIGTVARNNAGPSLPISFLCAGAAAALSAFCYAELSSRCPSAGSAYHYAYTTVGEIVAWLIGWGLILEYTIGGAAVARGISPNLATVLGGPDSLPSFLARFPVPGTSIILDPCAALAVMLVTTLVGTGIKESAAFQSVVTVSNIIILTLVVAIGIVVGTASGWPGYSQMPTHGGYFPFGVAGTLSASAVVFYSYIGFDAVCTAAEEVKRPQKDLPLGIGLSLFVCASLYMGVAGVLVGLVPYNEINPDIPMSDAFDRYNLPWAKYLVTAGALAALCTTLLGSIIPQPRILMAMARDGLLPEWFSNLNPRTGVPLNATIITGLFAASFAFIMNIEDLSNMVSVGTLLAFSVVNLSVLILRYVPPQSVHAVPPPPSVSDSTASTFPSVAQSLTSPRSSALNIASHSSSSSVFGGTSGSGWQKHMMSQASLTPAAVDVNLPESLFSQLGSLDSIGNSPATTLLTGEQLSLALRAPINDSQPSTPENESSGSDGSGGGAQSKSTLQDEMPFEMSIRGRVTPESEASESSDATGSSSGLDEEPKLGVKVPQVLGRASRAVPSKGGACLPAIPSEEADWVEVLRAKSAVEEVPAQEADVRAAARPSGSCDWVEALRSQEKGVEDDQGALETGVAVGSTSATRAGMEAPVVPIPSATVGDWDDEGLDLPHEVPGVTKAGRLSQGALNQNNLKYGGQSEGSGEWLNHLKAKAHGSDDMAGIPWTIEEEVDAEIEDRRRHLASWSVISAAIGAPLLAASVSWSGGAGATAFGFWWTLRYTGMIIGGLLFGWGLLRLVTLNQDNGRHSFGSSGGFECPGVPVLPLISYLVNSYLMVNLGSSTLLRSGVWLVFGAIVYITYGIHHSSLAERRPVARIIQRGQRTKSWWDVLPRPHRLVYGVVPTNDFS